MSTHAEEQHHVPYKVYFLVWAALLVLTVVTVSVSYVDMKNVKVLTAMLIATAKSMLVLLYFMHIRFEKPLYSVMILAAMLTYGIFVALTFVDYLNRYSVMLLAVSEITREVDRAMWLIGGTSLPCSSASRWPWSHGLQVPAQPDAEDDADPAATSGWRSSGS
jgi:cytochrome c oxidase subunit 4